jgi:hypothetical protein
MNSIGWALTQYDSCIYKSTEGRPCKDTPVILVTEEAEIRRITVQSQFARPHLEKNASYKKGLVEWLKV